MKSRIVGIDFGTVKCGLAITDRDEKIAWSWCVVPPDLVLEKLQQAGAELVIVGLPDGKFGEKARQFAKDRLADFKVEFVPERFTTRRADEVGGDDATAAVFILREFLDKD